MPDALAITDAVRSFLRRSDQTLTDELRNLAREHAEALDAVNTRLRRCEEYLRRGLLGEAVHLAELEPPLLDLLRDLRFPEQQQWDEIVHLYNLPAGDIPDDDRAVDLNAAYGQHQQIEPLLRDYRRLVLSEAPLAERLVVVRRLAEQDVHNPEWRDILQRHEAETQKELINRAAQARDAGDLPLLNRLLQELRETRWVRPPVPTALNALVAGHSELASEKFRRDLHGLVAAGEQAMAGNDPTAAGAVLARMKELMPQADLPPGDPDAAAVFRLDGWLTARLSHAADLQQLETMLVAPEADPDVLTALYSRLLSGGLPLPTGLKKRVKARVEELVADAEVAATRASEAWLLFFSMFGIGLLALGLVLWLVIKRMNSP
jgi:hypothetical protein